MYEDSPVVLIMEGLLNSKAAGILMYMALIDLLAEDLADPKVKGSWKLYVFKINCDLVDHICHVLYSHVGPWATAWQCWAAAC